MASSVPDEVFVQILSNLRATDLIQSARLVCKRWKQLLEKDSTWKLICEKNRIVRPSWEKCSWKVYYSNRFLRTSQSLHRLVQSIRIEQTRQLEVYFETIFLDIPDYTLICKMIESNGEDKMALDRALRALFYFMIYCLDDHGLLDVTKRRIEYEIKIRGTNCFEKGSSASRVLFALCSSIAGTDIKKLASVIRKQQYTELVEALDRIDDPQIQNIVCNCVNEVFKTLFQTAGDFPTILREFLSYFKEKLIYCIPSLPEDEFFRLAREVVIFRYIIPELFVAGATHPLLPFIGHAVRNAALGIKVSSSSTSFAFLDKVVENNIENMRKYLNSMTEVPVSSERNFTLKDIASKTRPSLEEAVVNVLEMFESVLPNEMVNVRREIKQLVSLLRL